MKTTKPTPADRRRALIARIKASLDVPKHQSISTPQAIKEKPAVGVFGSV